MQNGRTNERSIGIILLGETRLLAAGANPELEHGSPTRRQLQSDRHDVTRKPAEAAAPCLLDLVDLPAARKAVTAGVEVERDGHGLVDDARYRDSHSPLRRAPG